MLDDDRDGFYRTNTRSHYKFPVGQEWITDRHPDKRPSDARFFVEEFGPNRDLIWVLEVRGLGVVVMRAGANEGDVKHGISTFTDDEIKFDKE